MLEIKSIRKCIPQSKKGASGHWDDRMDGFPDGFPDNFPDDFLGGFLNVFFKTCGSYPESHPGWLIQMEIYPNSIHPSVKLWLYPYSTCISGVHILFGSIFLKSVTRGFSRFAKCSFSFVFILNLSSIQSIESLTVTSTYSSRISTYKHI